MILNNDYEDCVDEDDADADDLEAGDEDHCKEVSREDVLRVLHARQHLPERDDHWDGLQGDHLQLSFIIYFWRAFKNKKIP